MENLKENWEVLHVEREPNGCCRANLNLIALVRAHCQGQESLSQAVREGGLVSIRDWAMSLHSDGRKSCFTADVLVM